MANNSKLYEKIWAIINGPKENASVEWHTLAKSNNLDDNETCFLLAIQLRKHGRKKEAYEASKALSEYNPSAKSYNIYLASAYDLTSMKDLSNDELNAIFAAALNFYHMVGYEVNLAATLLKCCNYLISEGLSDNNTFEDIYSTIPDEDKNKNSFIISQYYKKLVADGLTEKVLEHYKQLLPTLKENRSIVNIIKPIQKALENEPNYITTSNAEATRKITIISDQENAQKYSAMLENFSLVATTVDIFSDDIIENLNKATHKSTTAIVILTDKIKKHSQFQDIFPFVLGFCAHKFGRNDVKVFQHKSVAELEFSVLNNFETLLFDEDLNFLTLLGKLKLIGA